MEFDDGGKWPVAMRLEEARQQRSIAMAQILNILDINVVLGTFG